MPPRLNQNLAPRPCHMIYRTRSSRLVNATDPKLVAAALGMNPGGVTIYLADGVDSARLSSTT